MIRNLGTTDSGCSPTGGFGPGGFQLAVPGYPSIGGWGNTWGPAEAWTNAGRRQVVTTYSFGFEEAWEDLTDAQFDAWQMAWAYFGLTTATNKPTAVFTPGAVGYCEPICTPTPGVGNQPTIDVNRGWVNATLTRNDAVVNAFYNATTTNIDVLDQGPGEFDPFPLIPVPFPGYGFDVT